MYFQEDIETIDREKLAQLQNEGLVAQVNHVWKNVPYYRNLMEENGVTPDDIKGTSDLYKLPLLTKDDLRDSYPFGMFGVSREDCVRIQSTSGTTGRRVIAGYTQHDVDIWEDCCARALVAAGATKSDICQISYGYGLFTGGAGLNGGSHKLGCMTVPMSSGNTARQVQFMEDLGSTILCCTPSYAAYLAEYIEEHDAHVNLRAGIFGAEPWTEEMRQDIEHRLGIKAYDIYGLTELSGPGVAYECECQDGLHINEDHFIAEIIDPNTHEVLPYGERGELVFSSIDKQAFPLLRYRTKDICVLNPEPCSCGRTHKRMSKPMGRSDDMLIVKGVNVFPSQIETVLMQNGCSNHCQIIVDRKNNTDHIVVEVEMPKSEFTGKLSEITNLQKKLESAIRQMLGIKVNIRIVAPKSIERSEGKSVKVIDKRGL
ncbi:MAG: phenylacetate--CoA ligase [Coriobacteriia bacterium]|nr:phenylacetate--CoA ligase [Coriobacteriia bacterium]